MMKQVSRYRDRSRAKYRIVALIICAALVISAVAVGIMVTTGFVSAEEAAGGQEEPAPAPDDAQTEEPAPAPPDPVYIEIVEYPRNMNVGDKATITYELRNAEADAVVKWSSSDDDIASVSSSGTVRALSVGKAEITATLGAAKASILVSVTEKVILPKSFKVEIEEFTSEDLLSAVYDMKIGDELHMSAKIDPQDATLNGVFEWRASRNGVVTIREEGELNEVATLRADKDGEVTVTVSYVDESRDESKRVELDDHKIALRVEEEKAPVNMLLIAMIVFIVIVTVIVIILIAVLRGRKRRLEEEERRERIAKKQREEARRERAKREERAKIAENGYERGYRDSEAEQFERITRVYDVPAPPPVPPVPPAAPGPFVAGPGEDDDEPEKPFSVDDIE